MKRWILGLLTGLLLMSACSTGIKKLDLTNVVFNAYYYGSSDPIPSMEFFPLDTNQITELAPSLKPASWIAVKKPSGIIKPVFSLQDDLKREFSFALINEKMLVVIKDNKTTYYYEGNKADYSALETAIAAYHQHDYCPDVSDLVLNMGLPDGENTLISDFVAFTASQSSAVVSLLGLNSWTVSKIMVPYDYGYELIIRSTDFLSIGFRREGTQEIAVIRNMLNSSYTVYDVPASIKPAVKALIRSYIVTDHPSGNFLDTRFVQFYIGFGEGFGLPVMLPEYIYTLTSTQADQLNTLFDLSKWNILNTIPEIYYYSYGLIDTNGNRFFFAEDGTGMVAEVINVDPSKDKTYYSIKSSTAQAVRQLLVDWYVPQPPSAYVRSLDFDKVYSGFDMEGQESLHLYDLTADQLTEFKAILDYDAWIQSYNVPGMGLNASYVVKTADSIHMVITRTNTQAWFLISDETLEAPQILGYYAPLSVYDAIIDYLSSHTPQ